MINARLAGLVAALLLLFMGLSYRTASSTNSPRNHHSQEQNMTIPEPRLADWSAAGIPNGIPTVAVSANVLTYGAIPDDGQDDAAAFQAAIDDVKGTVNNAILIPTGTYVIGAKLRIDDSVVLRGEGSDLTHLKITVSDRAIEVLTFDRGAWIDVVGELSKGAKSITVADPAPFSVGGFVEIQQENDPAKMYTDPDWQQDWAEDSVGQFGTVAAISGNVITLQDPLNIDFAQPLSPQIRTQGLVSFVGIEDLHLDRRDDPNPTVETVYWKNAAYTWMLRVHSEWAESKHVSTESVYGCEVRDSYFHHAHNVGTGGNGYGVELGFHTTGCLVENNIFHSLRHSMMVHLGANGNVFGYNYSFDSSDHLGNLLPDISLHGHYPFANLFEGNIVEEIGHGDFWGPAGPHNTSLRNCVTVEGLWYEDFSHGQNIIGNELTNSPDNFIGSHDESVSTDLIIHGNYMGATQTIEWDAGIAERVIPNSYYLTAAPAFYADMAWPSTGADMAPSCVNPAQVRYIESLPELFPAAYAPFVP